MPTRSRNTAAHGSTRPSERPTARRSSWPTRTSRRRRRGGTIARVRPMTRLGWIGTGVMGGPMAGHLLEAGHEVHVFNRTRERAEGLLEKGAHWCDSPAEVGEA